MTGSRPTPPAGRRGHGADEATAALLRAALHREAGAVVPSADGLARILAAARAEPGAGQDGGGPSDRTLGLALVELADGTERRLRRLPHPSTGPLLRRLPRLTPSLAAAAAVVLLVAGLGVLRLGLGDGTELARLTGAPVSERTGPAAPVASPLPVYLVERQNGQWALVREFVPTELTDPGARLDAALRIAVRGAGSDPDHTSAWSVSGAEGEVHAVAAPAGITVRLDQGLLGGRHASGVGPGGLPDLLAVQQLVWTATATAGSGSPVTLTGPVPGGLLFGSVPLDRPFGRGSGPSDPRAPVWVSSVVDGQRLVIGTATLRGDATATASGTVSWSVQGPDTATTRGGTVALTRADGRPARAGERAVWQLAVSLPATGRYLLRVTQAWPDGAGRLPWTDTKTLVVAPPQS